MKSKTHNHSHWTKFLILLILLSFMFVGSYFKKQDNLSNGNILKRYQDDKINETDCEAEDIRKAEDKCAFVRRCEVDGKINYLVIHYCNLKDAQWFSYIFLIFMTLLFFFYLGSTADRFFIPSLSRIALLLKMSPNIAGVTILAFGNGAPDIFSNFANVQQGHYEQSLGQLTGAGLFICTIVISAVTLVSTPYKGWRSIFSMDGPETKRRPFLRNVGFLTIGMAIVFLFCYDFKFELWEAVVCLCLYVAFVVVVILGRIIYRKSQEQSKKSILREEKQRLIRIGQTLPMSHPLFRSDTSLLESGNDSSVEKYDFIQKVVDSIETNDLASLEESETETYQDNEEKRRILREILDHMDVTYLNHIGFWDGKTHIKPKKGKKQDHSVSINNSDNGELGSVLDLDEPERSTENVGLLGDNVEDQQESMTLKERFLDYFDWEEQDTIPKKIWWCLNLPALVIQHLTMHYAEDGKYFRLFYYSIPPFMVLFIFFVYDLWNEKVTLRDADLSFVIVWILPFTIVMSIAIFFTTTEDSPPVYDVVFLVEGCVTSIIWISFFASELVSLLTSIGKILDISEGIMGITVLAWGNSVGDMVANVVVAKKGMPEMAIGACYSAPFTNIMIGMGLAMLVKTLSIGGPVIFDMQDDSPDLTNTIYFSFCFLLGALLVTLVLIPASRFRFTRPFGVIILIIYITFIVVAVLSMLDIMLAHINLWLI